MKWVFACFRFQILQLAFKAFASWSLKWFNLIFELARGRKSTCTDNEHAKPPLRILWWLSWRPATMLREFITEPNFAELSFEFIKVNKIMFLKYCNFLKVICFEIYRSFSNPWLIKTVQHRQAPTFHTGRKCCYVSKCH